ncbi:hypothetical protein A9Q81_01090 [Gammaproteobacteria bacterium 42_54_T18]|nr:hypothetical protein A9Q81_01090 [Gammaproteobacteria bacterium 42_54_T18]
MAIGEIAGSIIILTAVIWLGTELYDLIQVKRGIFPKKSETTVEDIKKLRDTGHESLAVKRFRQLPEHKGIYTLKGASKMVSEL